MEPTRSTTRADESDFPAMDYAGLLGFAETQTPLVIEDAIVHGLPRETLQSVFGDVDDARAFMHAPHPELHGRRPVDAALSELGERAVERVLNALAFGLPV